MSSIEIKQCSNCGAKLGELKDGKIVCTYCGSTYSLEDAERLPVVKMDNDEVVKPVTPNNDEGNGTAITILIFCIVIISIVVVAINNRNGNNYHQAATDSLKVDTTTTTSNFLTDPSQDDASKKHIKRSNPDQQIIKKSRVSTDKFQTTISVTFQNATRYKTLDYAYFTFTLYDSKGIILETGEESNKRDLSLAVNQGDTQTADWSIKLRVPEAKRIKIKLTRVITDTAVLVY